MSIKWETLSMSLGNDKFSWLDSAQCYLITFLIFGRVIKYARSIASRNHSRLLNILKSMWQIPWWMEQLLLAGEHMLLCFYCSCCCWSIGEARACVRGRCIIRVTPLWPRALNKECHQYSKQALSKRCDSAIGHPPCSKLHTNIWQWMTSLLMKLIFWALI